jgi:hypothetical protein
MTVPAIPADFLEQERDSELANHALLPSDPVVQLNTAVIVSRLSAVQGKATSVT